MVTSEQKFGKSKFLFIFCSELISHQWNKIAGICFQTTAMMDGSRKLNQNQRKQKNRKKRKEPKNKIKYFSDPFTSDANLPQKKERKRIEDERQKAECKRIEDERERKKKLEAEAKRLEYIQGFQVRSEAQQQLSWIENAKSFEKYRSLFGNYTQTSYVRLLKDLKQIEQDPLKTVSAAPLPNDFFK